MSNIYYVYALIDPITDLPFYIGKGKNNRCYSHLKETQSNTDNIFKFRKIQSIISNGRQVIDKITQSKILVQVVSLMQRVVRSICNDS